MSQPFDTDELFDDSPDILEPVTGSFAGNTAVADDSDVLDETDSLFDGDGDDDDDNENDDDENDGASDDDDNGGDKPCAQPTVTAEPATASEHDLLQQIAEAEKDCAKAESNMSRAKAALKAAKGKYGKQVESLRSLCRALQIADRPLLHYAEEAGKQRANNAESNPNATGETTEPSTEDDSWKEFPIADLDIPDGIVKILHNAEITTMGDLAGYSAAGKQLSDLKGLGAAKLTQIDDATEKFWSQWNADGNRPVA